MRPRHAHNDEHLLVPVYLLDLEPFQDVRQGPALGLRGRQFVLLQRAGCGQLGRAAEDELVAPARGRAVRPGASGEDLEGPRAVPARQRQRHEQELCEHGLLLQEPLAA